VRASKKDVNQEEQEVLLVVEANTIVDPRTVMVHAGNATTAS